MTAYEMMDMVIGKFGFEHESTIRFVCAMEDFSEARLKALFDELMAMSVEDEEDF